MKKFIAVISILHVALFMAVTPAAADDSEVNPTPVSYDMAYPGLLPDHPLYFLKVARDNVMGFFKGKPEEKAAFALHQAEKHIGASHILITQKNNPELAYTSLQESQNFLAEAIAQTQTAKEEGWDTKELCDKVKHAGKKYTVVLKEVEKYYSPSDSKQFAEEKKKADKLLHIAATMRH
jgi:hypothetical protein